MAIYYRLSKNGWCWEWWWSSVL